jgi:hypothetical protein
MASKRFSNDGEHSIVLQPSNISFLIPGSQAKLDEAVVGVGNGLKEVGNSVRKNAVVLQQPSTISFIIPGRQRAA